MTLNLRPTPRILDGQNNTILFHHAVYIPRLCMRQRQHFGLGVHSLTNHRNADGRVLRQCTSLTSITSYVINSERNDMSLIDADDSELAASTEAESQQILEWPAICKQVACFCGTSIAAELVARGQLPRGRSLEESELLLQQTAEAMQANLEVQGCFDIRPAVEATAAGGRLNAKQLEGVAATLEAAFLLKAAAKVPEEPMDDSMSGTRASSSGSSSSGSSSSSSTNSSGNSSSDSSSSSDLGTSVGASSFSSSSPSSSSSSLSPSLSSSQPSVASLPSAPRPRFPSLAALAEGISDEERTLLRAIRSCIRLNSVCNEASEALAAVRAERQSNKERLRQEVESWARLMQQRGAAETGAVSIVRGRFCVGVRAGRQGELPRGSVRLSSSSTGATLYMEPQPCVELNNAEALLAEREEMEVQRVLALLSKLLASRASQVLELLDSVTVLDVVAARAKHGRWLGGVRPTFAKESGTSPLSIPGALHPVLMQRGLQPLPQPPSVDDNRFDRDFQAAPAWELRRVLVPDGPRPGELPDGSTAVTGDDEVRRSMLPRPLDLRVPPGKAVVAITGPNTGGKTVSLKAAGLMVLMAQAGLFLPCDPIQIATHGSPRLAWFDRVLADIGDAQSLQQNLSTFSGHIRRIRRILSTAGSRSLVLLDEVGSGTDPLEGAALARAVLDRLAGQAQLTLATTHHAELKRVVDEDGRYVNVSMAFDTATLSPTYQLVWGAAGASNALDIAEALGFDRLVVLEARNVAQALAASTSYYPTTTAAADKADVDDGESPFSGSGGESHIAVVARSLVRQLDETRQELEAQRMLRQRREAAQARLQETIMQVREMEQQLKLSPREIVMERDSLAADVQLALDAFAQGLKPQAPVEEALSRIEALIPEEVAAYRGQSYPGGADDEDDPGSERTALRPGDSVLVKSYGDMGSAVVVSVKGDYVTVKFDILPFSVGAKQGHKKRFHRREVQRVSQGSAVPMLGSSAWQSGYSSLDSDIKRVLGELSAEERQAAAEAAARLRAEQLAEESGHASYSDLYGALDVDEVAADLDTAIDDPDLAALVDSLGQEEEIDGSDGDTTYGSLYDTPGGTVQQQQATGGKRKAGANAEQSTGSSSSGRRGAIGTGGDLDLPP